MDFLTERFCSPIVAAAMEGWRTALFPFVLCCWPLGSSEGTNWWYLFSAVWGGCLGTSSANLSSMGDPGAGEVAVWLLWLFCFVAFQSFTASGC